VGPLIGALKDPEWRVRYIVAWALGPPRDPRAILPLIEAMKDPEGAVCGTASGALLEITGECFGSYEKWQQWWEQNKGRYEKEVPNDQVPKSQDQ